MTKNYDKYRVIGSSDVYSRKHIDRQNDRLERLYHAHKGRIRELEDLIATLAAGLREARSVAHNNSDRINLIVSLRAEQAPERIYRKMVEDEQSSSPTDAAL